MVQEMCADLKKQAKTAQAGLAAANERLQDAQAARRKAAADEQAKLEVCPSMLACKFLRSLACGHVHLARRHAPFQCIRAGSPDAVISCRQEVCMANRMAHRAAPEPVCPAGSPDSPGDVSRGAACCQG